MVESKSGSAWIYGKRFGCETLDRYKMLQANDFIQGNGLSKSTSWTESFSREWFVRVRASPR